MKDDPRREFVICILLVVWLVFVAALVMINAPYSN